MAQYDYAPTGTARIDYSGVASDIETMFKEYYKDKKDIIQRRKADLDIFSSRVTLKASGNSIIASNIASAILDQIEADHGISAADKTAEEISDEL